MISFSSRDSKIRIPRLSKNFKDITYYFIDKNFFALNLICERILNKVGITKYLRQKVIILFITIHNQPKSKTFKVNLREFKA